MYRRNILRLYCNLFLSFCNKILSDSNGKLLYLSLCTDVIFYVSTL